MDLVSLFTKNEDVAGIQISDDFLRLALLGKNYEKRGNVYIKELIEEPLAAGVVSSGVVKDKEKFTASLTGLLSKSKHKINYAVVSVPHLNMYSKIFSFPKNVAGEHLRDAMKVTVNFSLPIKTDSSYIDWETVPSESHNELLLTTAPKEIVDAYTSALASLRVAPIALESNLLSTLRMTDMNVDGPVLVVFREKDSVGFIVTKNKTIRFASFLKRSMTQGEIDLEVGKISDFYEADQEPIAQVVDSAKIELPKKFANYPTLGANSNVWLTAIGAAMRGLLPRSKDTLISLMPIGTEEAYANKEKLVFLALISDMASALAIFTATAFVIVWLLMMHIESSIAKQISVSSPPVSGEAQKTEAKAMKLNSMVGILSDITSKSPMYSLVLDEIRTKVVSGIIVTSVSITGVDANITLNGVASQRKDISAFRKSLEESELFAQVQSPPSNLELKKDIPFNVIFKLKDPNALYKK